MNREPQRFRMPAYRCEWGLTVVPGDGGDTYQFDLSRVDVRAVAHGLSLVNRFCGATERPYSVAEHTVRMVWWVRKCGRSLSRSDRYAILLHDADEAFGAADAHGGLKRVLAPAMRSYGVALRAALWDRLVPEGVGPPDNAWVHNWDALMGDFEAHAFGFPNGWNPERVVCVPTKPECWAAEQAERAFLREWETAT